MTLRARLLAAMGVVAVLLLAASFAVTRTTSDHLVAQIDDQLERFDGPGAGPGPGVPAGSDDSAGQFPPPPPWEDSSDSMFSTVFIGVFTDGDLVTRLSPNLGQVVGAVPLIDEDAAREIADSGEHLSVGSTVTGTEYRVSTRTGSDGHLIVSAVLLDDVNATVSRLIQVQVSVTVLVLLILGLVTWWVLRLGVRPLRSMTDAATTVAQGDLSHRIPEAPVGTEAGDLGVALNTMLTRIEGAFDERSRSEQRMRRFIADASHELRTPLTTIRGYAELFRVGALDDPDKLDSAMQRTESEAIRMSRLVEDLLTLARLDEGVAAPARPTALDAIAEAVVSDVSVTHPDRDISIETEPVTVVGVADQLHQVVSNLVVNALIHTPPDASVSVRVEARGDSAVVLVADEGPGMTAADLDHAFERFHRVDPSRTRSTGGSGLGLSIVAAIVAANGGTVELRPARPDAVDRPGLVATVTLPTAAPGEPSDGTSKQPEVGPPIG